MKGKLFNNTKGLSNLFVFFLVMASILTGCGKGSGSVGAGGGNVTTTNSTNTFPLPADAVVIDEFDRTTISPWRFWTPGSSANGGIEIGSAAYSGSGSLSLNYDFTCNAIGERCGEYVASLINLSDPIDAGNALTFMTRSAPNINVVVRVIDQSGQTLQYQSPRSLEGYDSGNWYPVTVPLNKPVSYWGGANNGIVQGKIKSIWILAVNLSVAAASGTLSIDRLAMLNSWSDPGPIAPVNNATMIDDFENKTSISPWRYWGEGGAGVRGAVNLAEGYESSKALALNYDLSCVSVSGSRQCGHYAAALLPLASPVSIGSALSFMSKSPANVQLVVRVIDQSGQTLQYRPTRSADANDPENWTQTVIDLSKPELYWGGARNGVLQTSIKTIWILAADAPSFPASGTLFVDNIVMLERLDAPPAGDVPGAVSIDDFQSRSIIQPWKYFNSGGNGASGSIESIVGYGSTRGLALNFNMTCVSAGCGKSAAAIFTLPRTVFAGEAISLMTKSPSNIQLVLKVIDQSGQTLQYRSTRPMAGYNADAWYKAVFALNKPELYWGGRNNGVVQGAVTSIWVIADNPYGEIISGSLGIDNIVMLKSWNAPGPLSAVDGVADIDNFENRPGVTPWKVWTEGGTGASGSVEATSGFNSSRGLAINYSLTCVNGLGTPDCGRYVAASLVLPQQASAGAAISFKTKSPADVQVTARVIDQSGQTLQYRVERPLEGHNTNDWYKVVIPLSTPQSYWGGANNGVVQGQINSIWIIAGDTDAYPTSGTVLVDDVAILSSIDTKYTLNSGSAPLVPVIAGAERIGTRVGVSYSEKNRTYAFDAAKAAGVSFIRTDLFWSWVEKEAGAYNFAAFDRMVDAAETRNLGVLFVLAYGNPLYDVKTASGIIAYSNFAYAAAARYAGRNVKFEIWNEPDDVVYWGGSSNPVQEYVALCNAATAAIKRANPTAMVTTGGLAWFNFDYLKKALSLGVTTDVDAVGIHGYRMGHPETLVTDVVRSNWWMKKLIGRTVPIWLTEWGYSVGAIPGNGQSAEFRKRQAVLLARQMLSQWILGMEKAVWFDLVDAGINPDITADNYGLLDALYDEKPSIQSLRILTSAANGAVNNGLVADAPAGLHVMKLDMGSRKSFIAWNSMVGSNITLDIPADGLTSIINYVGAPVAGRVSGGRMFITVKETDGPIYIFY